MVKAILEGRKTQTRRIVKPTHVAAIHDGVPSLFNSFPYGKTGDRLWVREAISRFAMGNVVAYKADYDGANDIKWRPSIHMPRWASRITLEVVSVRVERLQDITRSDIRDEGILVPAEFASDDKFRGYLLDQWIKLWESINGPGSWEANPWVWVVGFKVIKP